ncbi:MAG: DUF5686 family protein [Proteiniphilum sp.]
MRKFVLFVLTVVFGPALFSQNILYQGKVIDAVYRTPVAYAAVYIQGTSYGTVADNVGEFSFTVPDSLQHIQLVIMRQDFKISYLSLDPQSRTDLLIALRPDDLEASTLALLDSLAGKKNNLALLLDKATRLVTNDWIPLGNPEVNKFDFGRIQTFPTYNPIEGVRLRAGIASNSRLNPHFFLKGYVAYGFKDQQLKYRGEAAYTFNPKAYHEEEFPKNNLSFVYENDLYSPGEMHPRSPNNLLLVTYRRSEHAATYRNFGEINYEREGRNGLAQTLWIRRSRMMPEGALRFQRRSGDLILDDHALHTTEVGLQLRYSVREAYIQQKRKRKSLEMITPVFFLSHTAGVAEVLGSECRYHRTEFSAQKRTLLGTIGRLDVVGEAMKIWNAVPFPLLVYPNQRHRHHIENNAFFLNRALEFMADEQVTLRTTFVGDDLLLSKLSLLTRLQVRELISLRASYGRLSEKNDPALSGNLYDFPATSYKYGPTPYVEGSVGFTNILGLLRVEYVHRFTYRDHPDALLGRIRVDVTL